MNKLVVFNEHTSANLFHNTTLENIKRLVPDCIIWDGTKQNNLDYFVKNKDNRLYEGVLDYCVENKIENLHILYLTSPELLLAEINYRYYYGKAIFTKITFVMDWRIIEISNARQKVMVDLLRFPCINKMFIFSSMGEESKYYGLYDTEFFNSSRKIVKFYVPIYADIKPFPMKEARKEFDLPLDKYVVLFFGAMNYGKGLDILFKAMEKVTEDVLLFIVCGEGRTNYSLDEGIFNNRNIRWLRKNPSNKDLSRIFATADLVGLPYRATYQNCGSSVLVQAIQAHRPVIIPAIIPFLNVIRKYKVGKYFEVEKVTDLADNIIVMKNEKKDGREFKYFSEKDCESYLGKIQSWETYVEAIF